MNINLWDLPTLERPPVIETALGVQFAPIDGFTAGHYGWFWKQYLGPTWTKIQDAPRLVSQFEKFGEKAAWPVPPPPVIIQSAVLPERIMFINESDDRIIQVQNDRFHYNWRKRHAGYPSFAGVYPEFQGHLRTFEAFLKDSQLDAPLYNQWELSYFNDIARGELWDSPSDWPTIFPGLFGQVDAGALELIPESSSSMLKYEIPPNKGRLYVVAQHAKNESGQEILQVNLTARGPVNAGRGGWDSAAGLAAGHAAIVRTFFSLSSPAALAHWGAR